MRIAGIDPGKKGALAICENGTITYARPFALVGKEVDYTWLNNRILEFCPDCVVLEKVHAMPGQGVVSMFTFGEGYGVLQGLLIANRVSYHLVTPQAWSKSILAGEDRTQDGASVRFCQRAFPAVSLMASDKCRTPHDGIADAICMAEFGYRTLGAR